MRQHRTERRHSGIENRTARQANSKCNHEGTEVVVACHS